MPHRTTDPHAPTVDSVNPREPIRNPGLHSAMTNPSYQCSDFRSCRSSMTASATTTSLRFPPTSGAGPRAGIAPGTPRINWARLPSVGGQGVRFAHAGCLEYDRRRHARPPDHGEMRLRHRQPGAVRGHLDLRAVRQALEHRADPLGAV